MRTALLCLLLLVAACGSKKDDGGGNGGTGASKPTDDTTREQARFDSDRKPEKVVEALGIKPGSRVADVGAGTGLLTVHLARAVAPNGTVVATDIDGAVLELLQSRLAAVGLAEVVERRVVGAETPGLEAGAYDAILLAEVDHYFTDGVAWLKAATAALKPGGRIVISNRIHHRPKSMEAAKKAGLVRQDESTPVPTHFIAVFVAPPEGGK
ncbi:MAG: methyltransferase domain-containing protein [Deltaproteobacteria bacterium]|nr:methyltransferase domain-containing protein [Deltaproteobacteria bacterium]